MHNTPAYILGIATTVPDNVLTQAAYSASLATLLNLSEKEAALVSNLAQRSAIQRRHTVISDFLRPPAEWTFFQADTQDPLPSTQKRNELYKQLAPGLSIEVAQRVLVQAGTSAAAITHIIYISCTGLMAPGVEFYIATALSLSPWVQRYGINFMGCFGALRGLALASALASQNPSHRILVVCTELCSLHVQQPTTMDALIGNALFADGSAAMIVGCMPTVHERPLWEIVSSTAYIIKDSPQDMTWDVSNQGFVMRLSARVPKYIQQGIEYFANQVIADRFSYGDADWAVHPGGKAIIQAVEKACQLTPEQTESSWRVLADYGNMSSATMPFVLEDLCRKKRAPWTVGLAFGPGLSLEGIVLRTVYDE